jgi:hypothetical protein
MFLECVEGYVEEPKGHVSKSLVVQSCKLALVNSSEINGMQRIWVYHTLSSILPLYLSFIKGRRYNISTTKMLLHW